MVLFASTACRVEAKPLSHSNTGEQHQRRGRTALPRQSAVVLGNRSANAAAPIVQEGPLRTARPQDQADQDPRDHGLSLGASRGGPMSLGSRSIYRERSVVGFAR